MSDDAQQYSIENQKAAIQEYAAHNGFEIVKTYSDPGRSGVIAKNRKGLRELVSDVTSGSVGFKAILVYDVSRWGRFPNSDEAAHYEFLCARAGIPLHYCAEPFRNDGTAMSSLIKSLKRGMAAEFSRELGEKVTRGKTRIVQMGLWVGGAPGYGYRRLMLSVDGKPKQVMNAGEHKSLTTDRVVLVPGPPHEVHGIREMFKMAGEGKGCTEIASELNRRGFKKIGKPWTNTTVYNTVTNPKYTGLNVWNRTTQKMRTARTPVDASHWISKAAAFPALVDQQMFDLAQKRLRKISDIHWTDKEILKRIRKLWKIKGRISESLFLKARNMPSTTTIHKHFGKYRDLYALVGYQLDQQDFYKGQQSERSLQLRRRLVARIQHLFPENVEITHMPRGTRSVLRVDQRFLLSIVLSRTRIVNGSVEWVVDPSPLERGNVTLLGRMNPTHDRILSYYVFPRLNFKTHRSSAQDPWLKSGIKLSSLSQLHAVSARLWSERDHSSEIRPEKKP